MTMLASIFQPFVEGRNSINRAIFNDDSVKTSVKSVALRVLEFLKGVLLLIPILNIAIYAITFSPSSANGSKTNLYERVHSSSESTSSTDEMQYLAHSGGVPGIDISSGTTGEVSSEELQIKTSIFLITPKQKEATKYVITSMANKSNAKLAVNAFQLFGMGKIMDEIHPLDFLIYILNNEDLKDYIPKILKKTKKVPFLSVSIKDKFLNGLKESLKTCSKKGELIDHLPKFIAFLKKEIEQEQLEGFIDSNDWDSFLRLVGIEV